MTRLMTPRELAVEVTRGTLEGLAESFEHDMMRRQRFSGRQIADLLRRTAAGLAQPASVMCPACLGDGPGSSCEPCGGTGRVPAASSQPESEA